MAPQKMTSETVSQPPPGCSLVGNQLSDRMEAVTAMFTGCEESRELPDGYEFRFPNTTEWVMRLAEFISEERTCCTFLTFELVSEANQGTAWLRIRGDARLKEFVRTRLDGSQ